MAGGEVGDPFEGVRAHYVQSGLLTPEQADVYATALKKGKISAPLVCGSIPNIDPKAARRILQALNHKGFLKERNPPHPSHKGGSGKTLTFVPVAPSVLVGRSMQALATLRPQIDLIDEHLENLSEGSGIDEALYFIEDHAVGIQELSEAIQHSKEQVLIAGRDCDEYGKPLLLGSLTFARGNGVKVGMVVNSIDELGKRLKELGVNVVVAPVALPPFLIVDKALLFFAFKPSLGSHKYAFLTSRNSYLIQRYRGIFDHFMGGRSQDGVK